MGQVLVDLAKFTAPSATTGLSTETKSFEVAIDIPLAEGMASRKGVRGTKSELPLDVLDDDDDKYRKGNLRQLISGFMSKEQSVTTTKKARPPSIRLTTRRILILFALLSTLATVIVLHLSLATE